MKIRNKLRVSAGISLATIILLWVVFTFSIPYMTKLQQRGMLIDGIAQDVNRLNESAYDFLLKKDSATRAEWNVIYSNLGDKLKSVLGLSPLSDEFLSAIGSDYKVTGELFNGLVEDFKRGRNGDEIKKQSDQFLARLQAITTNTFQLADVALDETLGYEKNRQLVTLGLIVFSVAIIVANIWWTVKSMVRPIAMINDGTKVIADGNMYHRVGIPSKDELGELSRAFDKMMDQLIATTVHRDRLAVEIVKREKAEKRYSIAFESALDAIFWIDPKDGTIIKCNKAAELLVGRKKEDMIGENHKYLYPTNKLDDYADIIAQKVASTGSFDGEIEVVTKTGRTKNVHATSSVLYDEDIIVQALFRDITKRKELENMKDTFVSTVSHEIRTPLTIAKEAINIIVDGVAGSITKKQEKWLGSAKANMDRLTRMVNDLLDLSKIEKGSFELRKELVDLRSIVDHIRNSFEPAIVNKGIRLLENVPKEKVQTYVDPDKIVQIFTNLVGNALKHTDKGFIEVGIEDIEKEIVCYVKDTGIGIKPKDIPAVFDKFVQFGRVHGSGYRGTGLGLSIAKELVELHGGSIWVGSVYGEGTTFTCTLPKYTVDEAVAERASVSVEETAAYESRTSLIVISFEDNWLQSGVLPEKKRFLTLKEIERTLSSKLRRDEDSIITKPDMITVFLKDCDKSNADAVQKRLAQLLSKYKSDDRKKTIDFVYGMATFPDDASNGQELLSKAKSKLKPFS